MKKKHFLFGILSIVILFALFSVIRSQTSTTIIHHNNYHPSHNQRHHRGRHHSRPHYIPGPRPRPRHGLIGGCRGTRYGCCPNSQTSCNQGCTNC